MADCIFCKIAAGTIPANRVAVDNDAEIVAFRDLNPQAPTHILLIPRRHIASIDTLEAGDAELVGKLFLEAKALAAREGLAGGWRTVFNVGRDAGQSVFHIHLHLLGGRALGWPPG